MNVVTAEQVRELDRRAMEEAGIPGVVLMENAGRAVVDVIQKTLGPVAGTSAAVFCGSGNNGGDGFVICRLLLLVGAEVTLFCTDDSVDASRFKPDPATHLRIVQHGTGLWFDALPDESTFNRTPATWRRRFDFAVDALLGTGIKDAPKGWYARAIRSINALECPVIAVDIPSGVDADSGAAPGEAVRADRCVTFAYPKLGLFMHPGYELAGVLHVSDIGFDWGTLHPDSKTTLLGSIGENGTSGIDCYPTHQRPHSWELLLQKRRPETNKGDYGHVGVVAGSRGMVGAAGLVARACQRAGTGLVTVLTAQSAQSVLAAKLDEQMTIPLPETDGAIGSAAWDTIAAFAQKATVLCVGPGLTTHPQTVTLVHRILRGVDLPIVLDADGLNALAMDATIGEERKSTIGSCLILTPHPGEAARLLGTSTADVQSNRIGVVKELARRFNAFVVLKGRYSLIADPSGHVCINTTGNPGMATGGMGDTLTGVVGSLVAQIVAHNNTKRSVTVDDIAESTLFAIGLAVHAHGIAGDIAAAEMGEVGLTAGDVITRLPMAFLRLSN